MQEALDMHNAWADHLAASGSSAGIWAWFTGLGAGQTEHDYKIVTGFADHNAAGAEWERFTNGGGWRKAAELNTGATSCDSARLYNSRTVRNGNVAPD